MEGLSDVSVVPDSFGTFHCVPSFFWGALAVVVLEIVILCYFVSTLLLKKGRHSDSSESSLAYEIQPGSITFSLQGNLWVTPLPEGDVSKAVLQKPVKDKKNKDKDKDKKKDKDKDNEKEGSNRGGESTNSDVLEIAPLWRHVVLKGGDLHLKAADGTEEHISLEGCEVLAVSSGTTVGGKWAKRYPIKLHHPTRALYHDCNDCLFYAESGYEKEAWCEVLRATTRTSDWCSKLKKEFKDYTDVAETHTPYVTRFHSTREANRFTQKEEDDHKNADENPSKKRIILNKLFRRNSKGKESTRSANAEEELGHFSRRLSQGVVSDDQEESKSASISRSGSTSSESDAEKSDEVLGAAVVHRLESHRAGKEMDQGLICLNMLVGRLFFDFYHSETRVAWLQNLFQKLISKIKTPTYIQSMTIKELDLGRDPPFATALRMLPADAAGALAMEVDFEWYGGGFITIETRIDVRDQIAQEKVASQMENPGSAGAAAAAIVEDLGNVDLASKSMKKNGPGDDSSIKGRWMNSVKSMMSRVADQVSQVPLMLKIRMVSVKGTCIISLRAPPSDRVWFSFKKMPDIDLKPEPIIGDRHISSGPVGTFIANQLKVQVRESIVLPLWQDLFISWMMAEGKDWIPQSALPVGFSAVPNPENERQNSKHHSDVQAKPVKENDKNAGQEKDKNVGQEKAKNVGQEKPQNPENLQPHSSSMPPQTQSSPEGPMQVPAVSHSQTIANDAAGAGTSFTNSEPSFPSRPSGRSSAPASIREEDESDVREPLVNIDDSKREKLSSSGRGSFDAGASDRVPFDRDLSQQSESVVLERELQNLSNELQVSNQQQDASKGDLSKESDSSASSRRTKIFSLGKKKLEEGKKRLEEGRRLMQEKMNREKREGAEGGGSSRNLHSGN